MTNLVVFYSLEGNTKYVAQTVANKIGADILELSPVEAYPDSGFKKFLWGGKGVVMKDKPELKPYSVSVASYDRVILATPVWAGSFAPPLRTFMSQENLTKKRVAFIVCSMSGQGGKCLRKMQDEIGVEKVDATLSLIDPKAKPKPLNDTLIEEFCGKLK